MILLQAAHISISFGGTPVLTDITLEVKEGERVGLVGVNGAGKSTLLKILAKELTPEKGEVMKGKEVTVGYLAQNSGLDSQRTIWEEMANVFANLKKMEENLRLYEHKMAQPENQNNDKQYSQLLDDYAQLQERFSEQGGYRWEADVRSILHGFRFYEEDYDTPIHTLSGGQKTRLALVRMLLQHPDVLILDEPTNHLDMETLSWLEQYLQSYNGGVLVVSHDRYFLDALTTVIYEIERTQASRYPGNYSAFLTSKAEKLAQQLKQYEKQQDEMKKMEDFIQRNIARASTSNRAKSRQKALEKMEPLDQPVTTSKKVRFSFDIEKKSGHDVLKVTGLSAGYKETLLLSNTSLHLDRGERVALLGPNGTGKSTLLKTLVGILPVVSGEIRWGSSVSIGYYEQEQNSLNPAKTVLEELWDKYPTMIEREIRTVLGNFLFSGDDVKKKVAALSGGEKARLSLAKLMLKQANVLILDEPTNHLDIYSKEVLEQALENFPGTMLFVSHDRYFLNKMANRVLELNPATGGLVSYLGNYQDYLEKKQEKTETAVTIPSTATDGRMAEKETKTLNRQRQRRLEQLEQMLKEQEAEVNRLEEELCDPAVYGDYVRAKDVQSSLETAREQWELLFHEWEELQESSS